MKHYEVVAAVIEYDNKFLCMQRDKAKFDYVSYKFKFPETYKKLSQVHL